MGRGEYIRAWSSLSTRRADEVWKPATDLKARARPACRKGADALVRYDIVKLVVQERLVWGSRSFAEATSITKLIVEAVYHFLRGQPMLSEALLQRLEVQQ